MCKPKRKFYHLDCKNDLIAECESQYAYSKSTGIKQPKISEKLRTGRRFKDGSYMVYDLNDKKDSIRFAKNRIIQYDLNDNELNRFDTIERAVEILGLNKNANSDISKCCRNIRKNAYGYKWKYSNPDKRINKFNGWYLYYRDGELVNMFRTRREIIDTLNINKSTISNGIKRGSIIEITYEHGLKIRQKLERGEKLYHPNIKVGKPDEPTEKVYSSKKKFYAVYKYNILTETSDNYKKVNQSNNKRCENIDYNTYKDLKKRLEDGEKIYYKNGDYYKTNIDGNDVVFSTIMQLRKMCNISYHKAKRLFNESQKITYEEFN